tara:strand:+ start:18281 stop:19030 length:750 start_codon:yes stop_codon:yes gene_type:complete
MFNKSNNKIVLSLYDYTGEALVPWAEAGYSCIAFDIQHDDTVTDVFGSGGSIKYVKADLHDPKTLKDLHSKFKLEILQGATIAFGMAFPVCTDLAVSGAAHFKRKEKENPGFQQKAALHAIRAAHLFNKLGVPFFIENPVSVLSTLWRKPDYSFHPYEYGNYIPDDQAEHPLWPEYIAAKDAYPKKTCLWTSKSFKMPWADAVEPENGHSRQHLKLGGKSMKTKNIRSATPRGFARAVYEFNSLEETTQ